MKRLFFLFFMGLFLTHSQVLLAVYDGDGGYYSAEDGESYQGIQQGCYNRGLLEAIKVGDIKKAGHFIRQGADVNFRDASGNTPLSYAVSSGFQKMVELLRNNWAR